MCFSKVIYSCIILRMLDSESGHGNLVLNSLLRSRRIIHSNKNICWVWEYLGIGVLWQPPEKQKNENSCYIGEYLSIVYSPSPKELNSTCVVFLTNVKEAKLALLLIKCTLYGIVQFLLYEYLEERLNCVYIYTKHSSLIINLHEQQTYTLVQ